MEFSQTVYGDGVSGVNATADRASLVDILAVKDSNDPSDSVIFQITGLPQHGTLYLGESPLGLGETFSQFDIDNGVLTYQSRVGELEAGTYRAGDLTGLPDDHYDFAWSGLDAFALRQPLGADALNLGTADTGGIHISTHGLGLEPAATGHALVLDFRAEVSGVRLYVQGGQENTGPEFLEAYDALGRPVDCRGAAAVATDASSDALAIAAEAGTAFRYLLIRTPEGTADDAQPASSFHVRAVEFDVAPAPVADAFSFRAEGGQALDIGNVDPVALGYTVVNGEAIFSIALASDLS